MAFRKSGMALAKAVIAELTNPGEPGLVGEGSTPNVRQFFWPMCKGLRDPPPSRPLIPIRRTEPFPHAIPVKLQEI